MSDPSVEYRILALYRFVPLVPSNCDGSIKNTDKSNYSNDLTTHPEHNPKLKDLQTELYDALRPLKVRGTLLLAPEGINGTICYPFACNENAVGGCNVDRPDVINGDNDPVFQYLKHHPLFGGPDLRTRLSVWKDFCDGEQISDEGMDLGDTEKKLKELKQPQQAFQRLKIKIKAEIVTMGLGRPLFRDGKAVEHQSMNSSDPASSSRHIENQKCNPLLTKGQYLSPTQWDDAVRDPNVLVIDTRNTYEIDIGTFDGAIDPKTKYFTEFPDYLERLAKQYDWSDYQKSDDRCANYQEKTISDKDNATNLKKKPPKAIAMFCTGGIRCEKATSYALQSNLFPKDMPIFHLEGGILAYLDHVSNQKEIAQKNESGSNAKSTFHGECFVFDKRVAVTEGLKPSKNYIPCYGCRGPMDRQLLLSVENNCGEKRKATETGIPNIPPKYATLMEGIPNLPDLKFDHKTKTFYLPGLTCPRCHDGTTRESLERFAQRKEQMKICAREGKSHFRDDKSTNA